MKSLKINSYAKINIGLKIINQRNDSYHNIETVFQELQFHDVITFTKIKNGYELSSNNEDFPIVRSTLDGLIRKLETSWKYLLRQLTSPIL